MDFFAQQARARRSSRWLFGLFLIAVIGLLALTHAAIILSFNLLNDGYRRITLNDQHSVTWQIYLSLGIVAVIAMAIFYKWRQLQPGGRVIAESLGCQRVSTQQASLQEKQLINVVEEMALACGLPVPPVYCLASPSINAFAAGFTPADAVVGVTRGALEQLTRDELQGVIAHEFSHIINGDMRLNAQLLALLFGIEFIGHAGQMLANTHQSYRYRRENSAALIGLLLIIIGYIGGVFAKMIKAAINRQREYLADAAAVQFTRYADGLSNALIKVAEHGSAIDHPQAQVLGHFFFGNAATTLFSWNPLATHPSLEQRLIRIKPEWTKGLLKYKTRSTHRQTEPTALAFKVNESNQSSLTSLTSALSSSALPSLALASPHATTLNHEPLRQPHLEQQNTIAFKSSTLIEWRQRTHEPYEARLLVFALALAQQDALATYRCRLLLQQQFLPVQTMQQQLCALSPSQRWQLLALAIPSIKTLSKAQYLAFKKILRALIQIDARIDLFEWSLFELVTHSCDAQFMHRAAPQPQYHQLDSLLDEYVYVLTLLIQQLHPQLTAQSSEPSTAPLEDTIHRLIFEKALKAIGINQSISWQPVQWQWTTFHAAQKKLALAYPLLKAHLIKGWMQAAQATKTQTNSNLSISSLTPEAQHLLTALAACLDVPFLLMGEG